MTQNTLKGNLSAAYSAFVWGTTFIVTKDLMNAFNAAEILFTRFIIAFVCLVIIGLFKKEKLVLPKNWKDEFLFIGTGLTGLFLYGVLEIVSMKYTYASNTSIIVSTNPFFTAICAMLFLKDEKPTAKYFLGFLFAIVGIAIISFNGASNFGLNPLGDLLAFGAAIAWGFYTTIIKKAYERGYSTLYITARTYIWGSLMMLVSMPLFGINMDFTRFMNLRIVLGYLFLGVVASGSCFMAWNNATKLLGALKSAVYIYMIPVVTIIFAAIFMGEKINALSLLGIAIVLFGTVISTK